MISKWNSSAFFKNFFQQNHTVSSVSVRKLLRSTHVPRNGTVRFAVRILFHWRTSRKIRRSVARIITGWNLSKIFNQIWKQKTWFWKKFKISYWMEYSDKYCLELEYAWATIDRWRLRLPPRHCSIAGDILNNPRLKTKSKISWEQKIKMKIKMKLFAKWISWILICKIGYIISILYILF